MENYNNPQERAGESIENPNIIDDDDERNPIREEGNIIEMEENENSDTDDEGENGYIPDFATRGEYDAENKICFYHMGYYPDRFTRRIEEDEYGVTGIYVLIKREVENPNHYTALLQENPIAKDLKLRLEEEPNQRSELAVRQIVQERQWENVEVVADYAWRHCFNIFLITGKLTIKFEDLSSFWRFSY
uniref:Uncharacterized protein n=1 Tax=Strongyloides papillosus TaxID=174720 RepID=A0A0N5BT24_STREA